MRALFIVAKRYNGHELFLSLKVLDSLGVEFTTATHDDIAMVDEISGKGFLADYVVQECDPEKCSDQYDALVIVSGNLKDTMRFWTCESTRNLVKRFHAKGKVVAAICCSVPALRDIVSGKKVSFFPLSKSKDILRTSGAIFCPGSRAVDGNIVTAENQMVTQEWAEDIVKVMRGEIVVLDLPVTFEPGGRARNDGFRRFIKHRDKVLGEVQNEIP